MKWYVEYYDEEGFLYQDGGFVFLADVMDYYNAVAKPGYELVKYFKAEEVY